MQDINVVVTKNFDENIDYLEKFHPIVFQNIVALESAIKNGHYKEKYELVYENENFDVLEISTGTYLYNKQIQKYCTLASQSINQNVDNNVFQTFHKRTISDEDLKTIEAKEPFMDHLGGFAPIINHIQNKTKDLKEKATFGKFIFFGLGLALHIARIDENIHASSYLLIEDDLELFRLSLFTTNYKDLGEKAQLQFSIFEDTQQFEISATKFLNKNYEENYYIKYFHMLNHTEEKLKQFHQLIAKQPHLTFFYHTMLKHYTRPLNYLLAKYNFLNSDIKLNNKHLRDKPFLLLAAGPSLEKNQEWLKENHTKFVIVAVAATLPFLEKENISPDIIIQLDGHLNSILHFQKLNSLEFIQNSIYFFSDKVPENIIKMLPKENLFLFENGTNYKKNSLKPTAFCVGSVALELLVLFEVKYIYLLGLDLALDQESGSTHSSSHVRTSTIDLTKSTQESDTLEYHTSLVEVEGNYTKTLLTTYHFNESIQMINTILKKSKKEQQQIINLSDGAMFYGTVPKKTRDINISKNINKKDLAKNLHKETKKHISTGVSSYELKALKEKIENAQEITNKTEILNPTSILSTKDYLQELKIFSLFIANEEKIQKYELHRIIDTYLRYILPYIFHYLNDELKTQEYRAIGILLSEHLNEIISFYIDAVKKD